MVKRIFKITDSGIKIDIVLPDSVNQSTYEVLDTFSGLVIDAERGNMIEELKEYLYQVIKLLMTIKLIKAMKNGKRNKWKT